MVAILIVPTNTYSKRLYVCSDIGTPLAGDVNEGFHISTLLM